MAELTGNNRDPVEHRVEVGKPDDGISLWFHLVGDRFGHQLVWQIDGEQLVLLRSIERIDLAITGPPLQEVVTERHGDSRVVLAVGQANKNHWSGSVSKSADGQGIDIDFACRVNVATGWIGSVYQVDPDCQVLAHDAWQITLGSRDRQFGLVATPNSTLYFDGSNRIVEVRPLTRVLEIPDTVVWKYSVSTLP